MTHPVDEIVDEWWKNSTRDTYIEIYDSFTGEHNFSQEQALHLLTTVFYATAEEFGGNG